MKILLIEDDIEISEMLCSYLIAENFEVVCATDGQKACEAFDIGSYSITYNKNHLERGGFYYFSFLNKIVSQE